MVDALGVLARAKLGERGVERALVALAATGDGGRRIAFVCALLPYDVRLNRLEAALGTLLAESISRNEEAGDGDTAVPAALRDIEAARARATELAAQGSDGRSLDLPADILHEMGFADQEEFTGLRDHLLRVVGDANGATAPRDEPPRRGRRVGPRDKEDV